VPWWRVLFRPPVLALASVMVLAGGAVLIGRHGDSMKAESPTAPAGNTIATGDLSLDKGATANGSNTTKALEATTDKPAKEADERQKDSETPPTETFGAGESGHGATALKPPVRAATGSASNGAPPPRRTEHATTRTPVPDTTPVAPTTQTRPPVQPPPPPPKIDPTSTTTGGSPGGGADATDDRDGKDKTEAKKDDAAPAAPEPVSEQRRGAGPRQPSIDQLVRQCQAAATRGDCAAVKSIAARIAKDDAEAYRSRVVKDAAIARCLN